VQPASRHRQLRSVRHCRRQPLAADQPALHDHRFRPRLHRALQHHLHRWRHGPADVRDEEHGLHVRRVDANVVGAEQDSSFERRPEELRLLLRRILLVRGRRFDGRIRSGRKYLSQLFKVYFRDVILDDSRKFRAK